MSYILRIPYEQQYFHKNKAYVTNISATNYKLATVPNTFTSDVINLSQFNNNSIIIRYMVKKSLFFNGTYNRIASIASNEPTFIDKNGNINFVNGRTKFATIPLLKSNGDYYETTKDLKILSYNYDEINYEDYIGREISLKNALNAGFNYYWIITSVPENYPIAKFDYEKYNCNIEIPLPNPYGNWQEQQNNLAFKHYLYQSHIRKEK